MAAASLDQNFKEELSAIEQCQSSLVFDSTSKAPWLLQRAHSFLLKSCPFLPSPLAGFRVLSEAERTAALYSLLQESTQVQIRFFITVLQQMARSDPMSALLSPNNPNCKSVVCVTSFEEGERLTLFQLRSPCYLFAFLQRPWLSKWSTS